MSELPADLNKLLVKDLQAELKKRNLPYSGRKAELISRLEEAIKKDSEGNGSSKSEAVETKVDENNVTEESESQSQKSKEKKTPVKAKAATKKRGRGSKSNVKEQEEVESQPIEQEQAVSAESTDSTKQKEPKTHIEKPSDKKQEKTTPAEKKQEQQPEKKEEQKKNDIKKPEEKSEQKKGDTKKPEEKSDEGKKRKVEEDTKKVEKTTDSPNTKRRKWGSTENQSNTISTDTIKEIITNSETAQKRKREEESDKPTDNSSAVQSPKPIKITKKEEEPEVREVPPSKKPVSHVLYIANFVRPFTIPNVKELLSKTGKIKHFGMDDIKSKCYVIYETQEEAITTREALHNLVWPPNNKTKLSVDFATEPEALKFLGITSSEKTKEKAQEKPLTLDDLFRKTNAKPHIYYLPLNDKEVEAKRQTTQETKPPTNSNSNNNNQHH